MAVSLILFIRAQYTPKLSKKSFTRLVRDSESDKIIIFELEGTETDEMWY